MSDSPMLSNVLALRKQANRPSSTRSRVSLSEGTEEGAQSFFTTQASVMSPPDGVSLTSKTEGGKRGKDKTSEPRVLGVDVQPSSVSSTVEKLRSPGNRTYKLVMVTKTMIENKNICGGLIQSATKDAFCARESCAMTTHSKKHPCFATNRVFLIADGSSTTSPVRTAVEPTKCMLICTYSERKMILDVMAVYNSTALPSVEGPDEAILSFQSFVKAVHSERTKDALQSDADVTPRKELSIATDLSTTLKMEKEVYESKLKEMMEDAPKPSDTSTTQKTSNKPTTSNSKVESKMDPTVKKPKGSGVKHVKIVDEVPVRTKKENPTSTAGDGGDGYDGSSSSSGSHDDESGENRDTNKDTESWLSGLGASESSNGNGDEDQDDDSNSNSTPMAEVYSQSNEPKELLKRINLLEKKIKRVKKSEAKLKKECASLQEQVLNISSSLKRRASEVVKGFWDNQRDRLIKKVKLTVKEKLETFIQSQPQVSAHSSCNFGSAQQQELTQVTMSCQANAAKISDEADTRRDTSADLWDVVNSHTAKLDGMSTKSTTESSNEPVSREEFDNLKYELALMNSRIGRDALRFGDINLRSPADAIIFVDEDMHHCSYGCFFDMVCLLDSIKNTTMDDTTFLTNEYNTQRTNFLNVHESSISASFTHIAPLCFSSMKNSATMTTSDLAGFGTIDRMLPVVKKRDIWVSSGGAYGLKKELTNALKGKVGSIQEEIRQTQKNSQAAELARHYLMESYQCCLDFFTWTEVFYNEVLAKSDVTEDEAWILVLNCWMAFFTDLRTIRSEVSSMSLADIGIGTQRRKEVTARYIWTMGKAIHLQNEYRAKNFQQHPQIGNVINFHLFENRVPLTTFEAQKKSVDKKIAELNTWKGQAQRHLDKVKSGKS